MVDGIDASMRKELLSNLNNQFTFIEQMSQDDSVEEPVTVTSVSNEDVYTLLTEIPPGKVSTYRDIATALGRPKASRLIGRIIANNPNPISVPCHRVVKSNGEIGGFMYGEQKKREILEKEGIIFQGTFVKNFEESRFTLKKQRRYQHQK
jgi:methylated-DNA-[protein]-cysteine S-methyltransferase